MQGKLTVYTEKSAAVLVNCRTFVILFLKETGLVGQARLADIPALGGVFLRQRVSNGHFADDVPHGGVQGRPLPIVGREDEVHPLASRSSTPWRFSC